MKNGMINIDTLVEKSVGVQLKKEMEISVRAIDKVVKKYAFLHDGDLQKTQNMIIDAFFLRDKPLLDDDDDIQVNMKAIVDNVSEDIKERLYKMIQEELATKVNIESLANKE